MPLPCTTARVLQVPARHPRTARATRHVHPRGHSRAAVIRARAETHAEEEEQEEAKPQGVRAMLSKLQIEVRRVRY